MIFVRGLAPGFVLAFGLTVTFACASTTQGEGREPPTGECQGDADCPATRPRCHLETCVAASTLPESGCTDCDASTTADGSGTPTDGNVPPEDGSAPVPRITAPPFVPLADGCFAPPDRWLESKMQVGMPNRGIFGPIATDGERLAVFGNLPERARFAEAVWIYRWSAGAWLPEGTVEPPEGNTFARKLDLRGGRLVVGGQEEQVFVFEYVAGAWQLADELVLPEPHDLGSGHSVWLSGGHLVAASGGKVHFFAKEAAGWTLTQTHAAGVDPWFNDGARSAERIALITGMREVTVLAHTAAGWQADGRLTLPGDVQSLALDGTSLLVAYTSGTAVLYERREGGWSASHELVVAARADEYSSAVKSAALQGNRIAIGTDERVAVFDRVGQTWTFGGWLHSGEEQTRQGFGAGVAVGQGFVSVLAPEEASWGENAGTLYTYAPSAEAAYTPTCVQDTRVDGAGTACARTGTSSPRCSEILTPFSLTGRTPAGDVTFSHGWATRLIGFSNAVTLVFTTSSPYRSDSLPRLSVTMWDFIALGPPPLTLAATFGLETCDGLLETTGQIVLDVLPEGGWPGVPVGGTFVVDGEGWALSGAFSFEALCDSDTRI